ncbi:tyrosine-protein phosphatase [Tepidiforma flava]|uniref:Tyrosine-protein phosphatase n=1 Tax=Tepidiforma flava TaxID=3004094 RepID=A0ABY7M8D4_9CHLR|nr:tyrosine-protein phosphatase [Tepidiforma flava]WBL36268.1 tyrosine-protein phosphatase [Tepidiforma flava]
METSTLSRELRLEVAHNVRHLGGYRTGSGTVTTDVTIRSASLHRLTERGLEQLREQEVLTIVDFRSDVERERDVTPDTRRYGIRVVHAPVFQHDASPVGLANEFPGFAAVYAMFPEMGMSAYRTLFETLAEAEGRVLFHCAAGKDRTGVAAALLLELAGVEDEAIIEDYTVTELLLAPLKDQWLPQMRERGYDEERAAALLAAPREDMEATLRHLRARFGSAEGYARAIGVSDTALSAVRARLTA